MADQPNSRSFGKQKETGVHRSKNAKPSSGASKRKAGGSAVVKTPLDEVTDDEFKTCVGEWLEDASNSTKEDAMFNYVMIEIKCRTCEAKQRDCTLGEAGVSCVECLEDEENVFCGWALEWVRATAGLHWEFPPLKFEERLGTFFGIDPTTGLRKIRRITPKDRISHEGNVAIEKAVTKSKKPRNAGEGRVMGVDGEESGVPKPRESIARKAKQRENRGVSPSVIELDDDGEVTGGTRHKRTATTSRRGARRAKTGPAVMDSENEDEESAPENKRTHGVAGRRGGARGRRVTGDADDDHREMENVEAVLRREEHTDGAGQQAQVPGEKAAKPGKDKDGEKANHSAGDDESEESLAALKEKLAAADEELRKMTKKCAEISEEADKSKRELEKVRTRQERSEKKEKMRQEEWMKEAGVWRDEMEAMKAKVKTAEGGLESANGRVARLREELEIAKTKPKQRESSADKEEGEDNEREGNGALRAVGDDTGFEMMRAMARVKSLERKMEEHRREAEGMKTKEAGWEGEKQALMSAREAVEEALNAAEEKLREEKKKVEGYRVEGEQLKERSAEDGLTIATLEGELRGYKVGTRAEAWVAFRDRSREFVETTNRLVQVATRRFELGDGVTGKKYLNELRNVIADELFRWEEGNLEAGGDAPGPQIGTSNKRRATEALEGEGEERDGKRARAKGNEEGPQS